MFADVIILPNQQNATLLNCITSFLTQYNIEHHHQYEANGETDGAEIAVLTAGCLWDKFLNNNIKHGSCGKSQHIGQDRH